MASLKTHLAKEHRISPMQIYLKEIIYGGNDGIITTFAVVAGFTGAQVGASLPQFSVLTVLLFGLANLFADATSMGLSNFLSLRSEKDIYKSEEAKERHEIRNSPESEKQETLEILEAKGFSKKQAEELTKIYATNEDYWVSFMMNYELEMPNPTGEKPLFTALATFASFIVFGFIPLVPYVLNPNPDSFIYSVVATFSALTLLGLLRFKVTSESILRSVLEIVIVGGISASIAYIVGTFFAL